jgi:cold shock CspA family protein
MLPSTEVNNNREFTKQLIQTHQHHINLIYLNRKVIFKYAEKFEDDSLNLLLNNELEEGTKVGNIVKTLNESYVFIESENEKYFAHFTDFADIKTTYELKKLKQGQLVSFEESQNHKGLCAKNVKIISS